MFPKIGVSQNGWFIINGKPYFLMDDLGGKPTIFGNIQIGLWPKLLATSLPLNSDTPPKSQIVRPNEKLPGNPKLERFVTSNNPLSGAVLLNLAGAGVTLDSMNLYYSIVIHASVAQTSWDMHVYSIRLETGGSSKEAFFCVIVLIAAINQL